MEVDDQREMVAGAAGEGCVDNARVADEEMTAREGFVKRAKSQVSGERAETRGGVCDLLEAVTPEGGAMEAVAPVVVVADEKRGHVARSGRFRSLFSRRKDSRPLFFGKQF